MSYPPSAFKTWTSGEILTASDLNNTVTTINNSNQTEDIDDYSVSTAEMRTQTDPFPAGSPSLATALSEEIARLRYQVHQILNALYPSKTYWYEDVVSAVGKKGADVASTAALPVLTDGNFFDVTGTTTITSINTIGVGAVIYLQFDSALTITHHSTDLVLPEGRSITTKTGDIATFLEYASGDWMLIGYSRNRGEELVAYRRPVLKYVSVSLLDVEANTGTANQTKIVFPDGNTRTVTEDTSSTTKYRRFDITADAEFTAGTEDSGLRAALSEATNTWYAIYAVKSVIDTSKFVLVGDTTTPVTANYATLNTAYGTNGWVYLGSIRNGDDAGATGDIMNFVQHGNLTMFQNTLAAASGNNTFGLQLKSSASATTLTWTYAAGTGSEQIPSHILVGCVMAISADAGAAREKTFSVNTLNICRMVVPSGRWQVQAWVYLNDLTHESATTAVAMDLILAGYIDSVLTGSNPVI